MLPCCSRSIPRIREIRRGTRPLRRAVRLERETIDGRTVVHNYGHGGAGFTVSWACAERVAELLGFVRRQPAS